MKNTLPYKLKLELSVESPPPLGHSVVEYRELKERSYVDPREYTAQLELLHGLLSLIWKNMLKLTVKFKLVFSILSI
jgi:hypothetical protein